MKYLHYIIFFLIISACQEKRVSQRIFSENDIISINLIHDEVTDNFIKNGKDLTHEKYLYSLSPETTTKWLADLSQIESFKTEYSGKATTFEVDYTIEINFKDDIKYTFQGSKLKKQPFVIIKKIIEKRLPEGKILYVKTNDFDRLFKKTNELRLKKLPLYGVTKLIYEVDNKQIELNTKFFEECIDLLREMNISGYPYSGPVDDSIKERFFINKAINSNIPGKLFLISANKTLILSFAKPSDRDAIIYLQIDGQNEIYSSKFFSWNKLENLLRQLN